MLLLTDEIPKDVAAKSESLLYDNMCFVWKPLDAGLGYFSDRNPTLNLRKSSKQIEAFESFLVTSSMPAQAPARPHGLKQGFQDHSPLEHTVAKIHDRQRRITSTPSTVKRLKVDMCLVRYSPCPR